MSPSIAYPMKGRGGSNGCATSTLYPSHASFTSRAIPALAAPALRKQRK